MTFIIPFPHLNDTDIYIVSTYTQLVINHILFL